MLEGTFCDSAAAHFQGAPAQRATVLGRNRASVVVPENASDGDLIVTTCDATAGPVTFRRASFESEMGTFHLAAPTLTVGRTYPAVVVVKDYVYVLGGRDVNNMPLNSVERARIRGGTLEPFMNVDGVTLAKGRQDHSAVVIGEWLYVHGGHTPDDPGFEYGPSIERARINPDGSLEPFAELADIHLTIGRGGHSSVIIGSTLYVLGGGARYVEKSPISNSGEIESFVPVFELDILPGESGANRIGGVIAVVGNSLFIGAGDTGFSLSSFARASISPEGLLSEFVTTSRLATARTRPHSIVAGKSLYVIGGSNRVINEDGEKPASGVTSIERAIVNDSGDLDKFSVVSGISLAEEMRSGAGVVVGNTVCVLGGDMSVECAPFIVPEQTIDVQL